MNDSDRPDAEQMRILARLDSRAKLAIAQGLFEEALMLKEAWLRECHPDESDAAIRSRLRSWRIHGRASLD